MKGKSMTRAVLSMQLAQAAFFISPAFSQIDGEFNMYSVRQLNRAAAIVRVAGSLSCDMGTQNNAQACDLRIRDAKTGKVFRLGAAPEAMRMYHSGSKEISVEGTLTDSETIHVNRVEKL